MQTRVRLSPGTIIQRYDKENVPLGTRWSEMSADGQPFRLFSDGNDLLLIEGANFRLYLKMEAFPLYQAVSPTIGKYWSRVSRAIFFRCWMSQRNAKVSPTVGVRFSSFRNVDNASFHSDENIWGNPRSQFSVRCFMNLRSVRAR